jgi:TRAP-type C4-dicarboxylate transport system permease small subunit
VAASVHKPVERGLHTLLDWLFRIEATAAVVTMSACGLLLMADVVSRELLGQGIPWAQRVAVYCATIAGMLGFVLAIQSGEHLRTKFLDNFFPEAARPAVARIASLLSAGVFLFLAYHSWLFVHVSYLSGYRGVALDTPVWPMQIILPYAFASATLRYLAYAIFPGLTPAGEAEAG